MKKGNILTALGFILSLATIVVSGLRAREDEVEIKDMIEKEVSSQLKKQG